MYVCESEFRNFNRTRGRRYIEMKHEFKSDQKNCSANIKIGHLAQKIKRDSSGPETTLKFLVLTETGQLTKKKKTYPC